MDIFPGLVKKKIEFFIINGSETRLITKTNIKSGSNVCKNPHNPERYDTHFFILIQY